MLSSPRLPDDAMSPSSTDSVSTPNEQPTGVATASSPRVELRQLTKRFRSGDSWLTVLDGVDLSVTAGEFVAILGPSGSGKSTLLALTAGLEPPTSGEVWIDRERLADFDEDGLALLRRRKIGFVFQSFELLHNLTALENVLLPLELIRSRDSEARAHELLSAVGLGNRAHHFPAQLSGGEQQRVALARAFAPDPMILLADEPTGNLDSATGKRILEQIINLQRQRGSTLILVTHDRAIAAAADRRVHLEAVRVIAVDSSPDHDG